MSRHVRRWKVVLSVALTTFAIHFANGTTGAQVVSQAQYAAQYQQVGQIDNTLQAWYNYLSTNNLYSYLYSYPGLAQRYATDPNYKAQYDNWVYQTQVQGSGYMQQLQTERGQLIQTMQAEVAAAQAAQAQANANKSGGNGSGGGTKCPDGSIGLLGVCSTAVKPNY
jgi:hypothetical protein